METKLKWGFITTLLQILLVNIYFTNIFVGAVQKSFNEVTRSSIEKCIKCAWKFDPARRETGRKPLSLGENVVFPILDDM